MSSHKNPDAWIADDGTLTPTLDIRKMEEYTGKDCLKYWGQKFTPLYKEKDVEVLDVIAWADGIQGDLGTENADKVSSLEAALSISIMNVYGDFCND